MDSAEPKPAIVRLTGVYDANGSLAGELSYWVGARLGRRHCSLCDVTHGLFRAKSQWSDLASQLPVPFEAVHLDERDPDVAEASQGREPCVVASYEDGTAGIVVTAVELEACDSNPQALFGLLEQAAQQTE